MARIVALLRGINVGGKHRLPMAELRAVAEGLGWRDIATYVQSGNLVATASGRTAPLAAQLEAALTSHCGFPVPVVVSTGAEFVRLAAACPFADAEPKQVHLGLAQVPCKAPMAKALAAEATLGERVEVHGAALWIDFAGGVARSKLTSARLDRVVGGVVTLRNLGTVRALVELVGKQGA